MNSSARYPSFSSPATTRSVLGRPITLVVISVLSIANVGAFAAYAARPLRSSAGASAITPVSKVYVTRVNKRLKADRLVLPNSAGELLERLDSMRSKDEAPLRMPEPQILLPSAPVSPDDDNDCVTDVQSLPGDFAQTCVTAIAAYRKIAAIPHRASSFVFTEHNARRYVRYV